MCALPEAVSVRLIDCLFGGAAICLSGRQFRALIRISGIGINGRGMSGNKSTFLRHFSTCNNNCKRNYLKIESRLARQRPPPWAMISIRVRQLELLANVETFCMRRHTHTHTFGCGTRQKTFHSPATKQKYLNLSSYGAAVDFTATTQCTIRQCKYQPGH